MSIKVTLELDEEQAMTILSALNARDEQLDDALDTQHSRSRAEIRDVVHLKFLKAWDASHARERERNKAIWSYVVDALDAARLKDAPRSA